MKKKRKFKLSLKKFKVANLNLKNSILGGTGENCGGGDPGTDDESRDNDDCDKGPVKQKTFTCKDCPPVFTDSFFC